MRLSEAVSHVESTLYKGRGHKATLTLLDRDIMKTDHCMRYHLNRSRTYIMVAGVQTMFAIGKQDSWLNVDWKVDIAMKNSKLPESTPL